MSTDSTPTVAQPTDHDQIAAHLEALYERIGALEAALERKDDRIADLEAARDRLDARTDELDARIDTQETTLEAKDDRIDQLESACDRLEDRVDEHETAIEDETRRLETLTTAAVKKATANKDRISELQARELEKGAHLREETVDEHAVEVPDGRLERITKDDGQQYFRLPEQADPLERGDVSLAYGDLLPIQQLARMDDDMLRSAANALPTRLAAKLWKARADSSVGDNPWETGCKDIAEYVTASDLRHWIRRQEPGVSDTYAKKLVSRVIDAMLDLSTHRVAVRKRSQRKNGLEYTERWLVLPEDVEVPGEPGGE